MRGSKAIASDPYFELRVRHAIRRERRRLNVVLLLVVVHLAEHAGLGDLAELGALLFRVMVT